MPDIKESNGRKYDQYGNVVEYSPRLSSTSNLLKNGSFEDFTNYWTRVPGSATVSMEGCQLYGNSALKMSSSTYTTDCDYYDASNQIIPGYTAQTGSVTGYNERDEFTRLSCLAITPSQAKYARLQGVLGLARVGHILTQLSWCIETVKNILTVRQATT